MTRNRWLFGFLLGMIFLLLNLAALRDAGAVAYTAGGLRDPFGDPLSSGETVPPAGQEEIQVASFTVQGLVWNADHPQAIVNDTIVEKGSRIGQAKILSIEKNGVKILSQGRELFLRPQGKE